MLKIGDKMTVRLFVNGSAPAEHIVKEVIIKDIVFNWSWVEYKFDDINSLVSNRIMVCCTTDFFDKILTHINPDQIGEECVVTVPI